MNTSASGKAAPSSDTTDVSAADGVGAEWFRKYYSHKLERLRSDLAQQKARWALFDQGSREQEYMTQMIRETLANLKDAEEGLLHTFSDRPLPYVKLDPKLPDLRRGSEHAAGIDLYNAGPMVELPPGGTAVIPCGFKIAIPEGHYGHVAIRSGLGFKSDMSSHIGVVDADFRGEVKVKLFKHFNLFEVMDVQEAVEGRFRLDLWRENTIRIQPYDRVAQLVILPYLHVDPVAVAEIPDTVRGEGGYGSTGT